MAERAGLRRRFARLAREHLELTPHLLQGGDALSDVPGIGARSNLRSNRCLTLVRASQHVAGTWAFVLTIGSTGVVILLAVLQARRARRR